MRRSRLALACVAALVVCAVPATAQPGEVSVEQAVSAKIGAGRKTEVNVMRKLGDWAFGAGIALAEPREDVYPEGWLFIAHQDGTQWTIAFEGEAAFPDLTGRAPDQVLPAHEKTIFRSHGPANGPKLLANGDFRTGMRLPYAIGQSWRYTGGPHGAARQSIDLAGGDGRVLAARGGTLYVMCSSQRGWLRVAHDRGYSTDYYHLFDNRTDNGATVAEGAFLGNIGTDVSCGGSATGNHVHFSLRQNSAFVGIASHSLGKWQVYNGAGEYQGTALHGSAQIGVGGSMYNYGALGFTQGVIDTNGGGVANRRSARGTAHTGRFGYATDMWNKLVDGTWVSDAFTWTGTGDPVNGWC
jgi:LasA protease